MAAFIVPAREVLRATPRTRIIRADLDTHAFAFEAGQAVFAGLADGAVRRPYSIACSPQQAQRTGALELLVQIDDHDTPDPHLERARPGTLLRIEGPFGSFALPRGFPEHHLLLIAGGTGIAPLRSILWDLLDRRTDLRIALAYSARGPEEFAYRDELATLADAGRITLALTVTREGGTEWSGWRGRIDQPLIASLLQTLETRCLICGPPALVADAGALLRAAGIPADRILTETYAA